MRVNHKLGFDKVFGIALLLLIGSLTLLIREIRISTRELDLHLRGMEE